MNKRARACAAVIKDGQILMVRMELPHTSFWTLPGGGLEPGETPQEAAVREVWEETRLRVRVTDTLFDILNDSGTTQSLHSMNSNCVKSLGFP